MIWTIPNMLTIARIVAAPCVALAFVVFDRPTADWVAFRLFVAAALTDFLDGWLARKLNQTSEVGKMLDPIADKAMVIIALLTLAAVGYSYNPLFIIPAALILLREVLVSGLREYLGDVKLPVTKLAKFKTTAQMLAIGVLFIGTYAFWKVDAMTSYRSAEELLRMKSDYDHPLFREFESARNTSGFIGLIGFPLLWIAAILTLVTGWDYFRKGLAELRKREGVR